MNSQPVIDRFRHDHDPVGKSSIDEDLIGNLYTAQLFDQAFDLLYTHLATAIRLDEEELQNAMRALRRNRELNSSGIEQWWDKIKHDANDAWNELLLTYRTDFAPSVEIPQALLRTKVPIWDETLHELSEIQELMGELTVDQAWQGNGAANYRSALPAKEFGVAQTIALAANARLGVEAVALIQATIDQALYGTILNHYFRMYDQVNRAARTQWSRSGLGRSLIRRSRYCGPQQLFCRTGYVTERFQELTQYIRKLCDPATSDWAKTSQEVSARLGTATWETRTGRVSHVAGYSSSAEIKRHNAADGDSAGFGAKGHDWLVD